MTTATDLLALQEADLAIETKKREIDELPEKQEILTLRQQKAAVEAKAAQVDAMKSSLEGEIRKADLDTATLRDQIETVQGQISASKDHRAVGALTHEMESFKDQIERIESSEMSLMEKREKVKAAKTQVDSALSALTAQEEALIATYRAHGEALQTEIGELLKKRARLVSELDPALIERYKKLTETKRGIAVAQLQNGVCSVCRVNLSAAQVDGLVHGDDIGTCPSCQRMIVVRGE